jgi:hypothetical protein
MKKGKINYVGWLGHGNLGDEAIYLSNQMIFSQYQLVPYNVHGRTCSINLFGGGTVLPVWVLGVLPARYNYAFGVAVRDPVFWGGFHPFIIEVLQRFDFRFLGVRDNLSEELLRKWGIDSEVIGDPCLLLEPSSYEKEDGRLVAVNVGPFHEKIWGDDHRKVLIEMIRLCKLIKSEGYRPVIIPFWKDDIPYVKTISKAAHVDIFENWNNIQHVLDFIASSHILIGEKLHSIVFSASTFTPFISIEYEPKCRSFSKTMGFDRYALRTDEIVAESVLDSFHGLLENWNQMRSLLISKVKVYRERLRGFGTRVVNDIESLPDDKWATQGLWESMIHKTTYGTDVFLYRRFKTIGKAWYRLPIRKDIEHCLSLLRTCAHGE